VNALHSLGQLIQSVEDSRGWTLREIARRVEKSGRTMSHAYVARLKREPIRSISYETLRALSIGLDLPERVVGDAALRAMGVHDIESAGAGANVAIAQDPELSERDRRILLAVVREMQGEQDEQPAGDTPSSRDDVEDPPQPDGITAGAQYPAAGADDTNQGRPDADPNAHLPQRGYENDGSRDDRPWEQDEYGLAAKRGRNRGREARQQQDREAEDGGA
jgi:transcriptional regulator with XRE-family HTH domain